VCVSLKPVNTVQVLLKSHKITDINVKTNIITFIEGLAVFVVEWEMLGKGICRENEETWLVFNYCILEN